MEASAYVHRDSWSEDIAGRQVVGSGAAAESAPSDAYWSVAPLIGAPVGNGPIHTVVLALLHVDQQEPPQNTAALEQR
jgi:hypothetical protein